MKLFLALVGVALAIASSLPLGRPLQSKTEYRFRYDGALVSGLPVSSSDSAITRILCDVTVQLPNDRTAVLRLSKIRIAASNDDADKPFDSLEKHEIADEHMKLLELPVRFAYKDGIISELQFTEEEQTFSANIKRAVINMLQLNWNRQVEEETDRDTNNFVVSEKTIEGDCKVTYTVVSDKKDVLVTKSVDFEKCENSKEIRYNVRYMSECPECEIEAKPVQPQTVYNYKIMDEELKEVEVRSTYTVFLKDQAAMKTEVRALLTLVESDNIRREIELPRGEKEELVYSTKWEEQVERFFKNGDEILPFERMTDKVETVDKIVRTLSELREHEPESVHLLARLVRIFRMSTIAEIKKIHREVYEKCDKKEKSIIEHAHAISGTKNCIEHLLSEIQKERIQVTRAFNLLKSIQETPFPSEKIADLIHEFAVSDLCRREPVLRQSAWLAFGAVVRGVVSPNMEKHAITEVSRDLKEKYLTIMIREYEKSESTYEKILAIKTIANAAIDISIRDLEKIINNKKEETVVRKEAIDALRLLSSKLSRKIHRVLLPICMDRSEKPEIRMVSLFRLAYAKPTMSVVSQMVNIMERESNREVATFVYYLLNSISETTSPCYSQLASDCKLALRMSRFVPNEKFSSTYKNMPMYYETIRSGATLDFAALFGKSMLPKDLMVSLESVSLGELNQYLAQVGFSQQNVEVLLSKITKKLQRVDVPRMVRGYRKSALNYIERISEQLKIQSRKTDADEPFGLLYIRYKQMDYAALPIDDQVIDKLIEKFFEEGRFDIQAIAGEKEFDWTHGAFFFETLYKMPTTLGLPLAISAKMPTLFSAKGTAQIDDKHLGMSLRLKTTPSLAMTHIYQMRVWTPLFEHGIKMLRTAQMTLPIDFSAELIFKSKPEIKLTMKPVVDGTIRVSGRPVLFLRFPRPEDVLRYVEAEEKTIEFQSYEKYNRVVKMEKEIDGILFEMSGMDYRRMDWESVLFGEQEINLVAKSTSRTPRQYTLLLTSEYESDTKIEEPRTRNMISKHLEVEESEWEDRDDQLRHEEMRRHARELISGSRLTVMVTLEGVEQTKIKMIGEWERDMQFCRMSLDCKIPRENRKEFTMNHDLEILLPARPTTLKQLRDQMHREIVMYLESEWGMEKKNVLKVNCMLEQSKDQNKLIKLLSERKYRGMDENKALRKAGVLNYLKASAEYKLTRESEIFFERMYDLIKSYWWMNTKVVAMDVPELENKIYINMHAMPYTERIQNFTITTSRQQMIVTGVDLPVSLPTIARRPTDIMKMISRKGECKVEDNKIRTFDDVIFRAPLSTCYSVVAKDCSDEKRFLVAVKKVSQRSDEQTVMIRMDEKEYQLKLNDEEMEVRVDGKVIRSSDYRRHSVEMISNHLCVVDLEDVIVHFDGYTVKVELSSDYKEKQCGLCGHYDDEKSNDIRAAEDDYETEDLQKFHRSYLLKDSECELDEDSIAKKKNYRFYSEESSSESREEYEYNEDKKSMKKNREYESEEDNTVEPEMKNHIVEYSHRVCISVDPIATCPKKSRAVSSTEKKVKYACLRRHQTETRDLLKEIRREPRVIDEVKHSMIDHLNVPLSCEVY